MSFDVLKNFWRSATDSEPDESIIEKTQNFLSSSIIRNIFSQETVEDFQDYRAYMPDSFHKNEKNKIASFTVESPELIENCYQSVNEKYFSSQFQIQGSLLKKDQRENRQMQIVLHEQLDDIQLCLDNLLSSRFDEILSVMTTIQSLEQVTTYSQKRLHEIRTQNFAKLMLITSRNAKIKSLIQKQANLNKTLENAKKIKLLANSTENQPQKIDTKSSHFYDNLIQIKLHREMYSKLNATKNYSKNVDTLEKVLKNNFSEAINSKIAKYVCQYLPYDKKFWNNYINRTDILEDKSDEQNSILLDQTVLLDQEINTKPFQKQVEEKDILYVIEKGWKEGSYSSNTLKIQIQKCLRELHTKFIVEFESFCQEVWIKNNEKYENSSLHFLLNLFTLSFSSKVFTYFFQIHKTLLLRIVSLQSKIMKLVQKETQKQQKILQLAKQFSSTVHFVIKLVCLKVAELIEYKKIQETADLSEFKVFMASIESVEDFIYRKLKPLMAEFYEQQFFRKNIGIQQEDIALSIMKKIKENKLFFYVKKMHKYIIEVELKESLENETWQHTQIPTFYYDTLHYLITGQSLNIRKNRMSLRSNNSMIFDTSVLMDSFHRQKSFLKDENLFHNFKIIRNEIKIDKRVYNVTETILRLIQIIQDYVILAQNFPVLNDQIGKKLRQIISFYNSSSHKLLVCAGIMSLPNSKLKSITARPLALSSLCLNFLLYIISCISKRVKIFQYQKLVSEIHQHVEAIKDRLKKTLMARINKSEINFKNTPSKGTENIVNSSKILYDILGTYFDKPSLSKIFTKQILVIYLSSLQNLTVSNRIDAQALKDDITFFFSELKFLQAYISQFEGYRLSAEELIRKRFEQL